MCRACHHGPNRCRAKLCMSAKKCIRWWHNPTNEMKTMRLFNALYGFNSAIFVSFAYWRWQQIGSLNYKLLMSSKAYFIDKLLTVLAHFKQMDKPLTFLHGCFCGYDLCFSACTTPQQNKTNSSILKSLSHVSIKPPALIRSHTYDVLLLFSPIAGKNYHYCKSATLVRNWETNLKSGGSFHLPPPIWMGLCS